MNFIRVLLLMILPAQAWANDTAVYSGELDAVQTAEFFKRYNNTAVSRLEINSSGGEVEAGIRLGLWVHERQLDVVVRGVCLSSCANYVFTAGRSKRVTPGSVVAWHGNYHHLDKTGLWRDDVDLRMRRDGEDEATAVVNVRQQVDKLVALEQHFFTRVGVDEYLCWVGKSAPHHVPDYYTLSAEDMARFGVQQVSLPQAYADTDFDKLDWDIHYIRLR
jgi:hypothetical protein